MENIKMGIGARLYFMSLHYHILIFMVGFLLYSIYALVTNSRASCNHYTHYRKHKSINFYWTYQLRLKIGAQRLI